jgi:hypothetical protein
MVNTILRGDPTREDSIGRGYKRWLRARDAASERPNTKHAALFRARLSLARYYSQNIYVRVGDRNWNHSVTFRTCSDFCAVLQWSIGRDELRMDVANSLLAGTPQDTTMQRSFRCFVCNRKVNKDLTFDDTNRVDFDTPFVYPPSLIEAREKQAAERDAHKKVWTESRPKFVLTPERFDALNPSTPLVTTRAQKKVVRQTFINTVDGYIFPQEPNVVGVTLTDEEFRIFRRLGMGQRSAYLRDRIARGV